MKILFDLLNITMLLAGFFVIVTTNPVHALFCLISVFIQMTIILLAFYKLEFVPFLIIIVYIGAIAILFLFVVMMLDVNVATNSYNSPNLGIVLFLLFLFYIFYNFIFSTPFYIGFLSKEFQVYAEYTSILMPYETSSAQGEIPSKVGVGFSKAQPSYNTSSQSFSSANSSLHELKKEDLISSWEKTILVDNDLKGISSVLYTTYAFPFLLSSFILLTAMLGAISLTLKQKPYVKRQLIIDQNHRDFDRTIRRITSEE